MVFPSLMGERGYKNFLSRYCQNCGIELNSEIYGPRIPWRNSPHCWIDATVLHKRSLIPNFFLETGVNLPLIMTLITLYEFKYYSIMLFRGVLFYSCICGKTPPPSPCQGQLLGKILVVETHCK